MAILAVLEVEDDGSLKIKNFRDAFSDLGVSVTKSQQQMAQGSQAAVQAHKQHLDAIGQLTKQARDHYAQIQRNGQAMAILNQQLKAGTTVTDVHAKALAQLSKDTQNNATFTQKYGAELTSLTGKIRAGTVVTAEQAKSLQNVTQGYNGVQQSTQQASSATEAFSLRAAALAATLTLLFGSILGLLKESGMLAARVETLGVSMGIVGKNALLSSQEMRVQVAVIEKLGITTQEATNAVIQFTQANLKLSDASKIARTAQDLAVISGQNSSDAFRTLTSAIQIQQPMLLRQFGIVTGLDEIYREYAKTIGKTVKELDGFDKKQAFVNKILKEGEEVTGAYEASMSTAGKQIGSFARYVEQAKLALGQAFLPAMLLGVTIATSLEKAWLALSPPLQNLVSALLAATAMMTAFAVAAAGAKLVGLLVLYESLALGVGRLVLMLQNSIPLITALSVAFGGWTVILTALAVAIGLATAAYVFFSKQAEIDIDSHLKAAAALEAEERSLQKNVESFKKYKSEMLLLTQQHALLQVNLQLTETYGKATTAQQVEAAVVSDRLEAATQKYDKALNAIAKTAPQVIGQTEGLTSVQFLLAKQLDLTTAAYQRQMEAQLGGAKAGLTLVQERAVAARAEMLRLQGQQTQLTEDIEKARKTGFITRTMVLPDDRVQQVTVSLAQLEAQQKRLTVAFAAVSAESTAAEGDLTRFGQSVEDLGDKTAAWGTQAERAALAVRKLASSKEEIDRMREANKELDKAMAFAKKTEAQVIGAAQGDPAKIREQLQEMLADYAKHTALMEAEGKKQEAARKSTYEKISGITKQEMGTYTGLSQALNEAGLSQQEYNRRLAEAAPILASYSKNISGTKDEVQGLAVHVKALESLKTYEVFMQWAKAGDEVTRSFERSGAEMLRVFNLAGSEAAKDFAKFGTEQRIAFDETVYTRLKGFSKDLRDTEVAQAREAQEIREGIYEQLVVSKMKEVDQAIYAEGKRAAGIVRSAELEKKARNDALVAERRAILLSLKEKLDALEAYRVAEERAAAERVARTLEDRARAVADALFTFDLKVKALRAENDLDTKMQAADKARADLAAQFRQAQLQKELADMLTGQRLMLQAAQTTQTSIRDAEAKAQADRLRKYAEFAMGAVDIDAKRVAAQNALTDKLTSEQIAASAQVREQIVNDHRVMKDFAVNAAQEMTKGMVSGFFQMITGAKSFKDELVGIFESLKRSLFNILNDMVQGWLDGMFKILRARMAATGSGAGQSGYGPYAQQAFGMAQGYAGQNGQMLRPGDAGYGVIAARVGQGWRAGSGFASSGWGGAVGGAGLGWAAGSIVGRYADGSYARGALGGAAAGAATGAVYGGWPGAIAGGIAGGISGWWQARKQRKQVIADRAEIVEEMGGMAEFKRLATEAGFAYEKFLNTKKPSEFGKEVLALKKALEELDLSKAQKQLTDFYGSMENLKAKAEAAGLGADFRTAFGPREATTLTRAQAAGLGQDYEKAIQASTVVVSAEDARKALDVLAAKLDFIEAHGGLEKLKAKAEAAGVSLDEMLNAKTIDETTAAIEKLAKAIELQRLRQAFIEINGGLDALRAKALLAGVSIDDLLNAKTLEEAQRAIEELAKALQLQELKQSFIDTYGSIERLTEAARAAGIDISKLLNAKTLEEATAAARELAKALELKKAKDSLYDVRSQLKDMQRLAKLVGFDLDRLFKATTIEGFNQAKAEFDRLVAVFQAEVSALEAAAAALNARATAFQATVDRLSDVALKGLDDDQLEKLQELYEEAVKEGYLGTILAFARENADAIELTKEQLAELMAVTEAVRREFSILGRETAGIFLAMVKKTGDWMAAMEAIGPALDIIAANARALGLPLEGMIARLVGFRNTLQQNVDVAGALSSINQIIDGLIDAKALTQDMFSVLGEDAVEQFRKLEERGVALDETMLMMQPTLQRLWEAQRDFKFETDAATQSLLDFAEANGFVGAQFASVESKMLEVLILIARVLGADIPEALDRTGDAAERNGRRQTAALQLVAMESKGNIIKLTEEEAKALKDRARQQREALEEAARVKREAERIQLKALPGSEIVLLPPGFRKGGAGADDEFAAKTEAAKAWATAYQTYVVTPQKEFTTWITTTGTPAWEQYFAKATAAAVTLETTGLSVVRQGIIDIGPELNTNLIQWRTWKDEIIGILREIRSESNLFDDDEGGRAPFTPPPPPTRGEAPVTSTTNYYTVAPTIEVNALDRANFDDAADEITDRFMEQLGHNTGQRAVRLGRTIRPYQRS